MRRGLSRNVAKAGSETRVLYNIINTPFFYPLKALKAQMAQMAQTMPPREKTPLWQL